jgi:hypothetical protein
MNLWTVWLDYSATGEGRSLFARIAYAEAAEDAIELFGKTFDAYYARGADAEEGVVENAVTAFLFSPAALEQARQLEGKASVVVEGRFHFNRS